MQGTGTRKSEMWLPKKMLEDTPGCSFWLILIGSDGVQRKGVARLQQGQHALEREELEGKESVS